MARASRVDLHGVIACIGHLAGDEAAPDQLVQPVLLARQVCLNALGVEPDIAGANGLVRVLRALLLAEMAGLAGIVGRAVAIGDKITRSGQRLLGQSQGVGTHIGDEADGALAADVDALIELLRNGHRAARRHIELAGGLLLQRGGDERRRRRAALFRALDARNGEFLPGDVAQDLVGLGLAVQLALLFLAVIVRREAARLVQAAQQHVDRPVFLRHEGLDLLLALHDKTRGNRLHAPGGQAAADLLPQQRAELVADDAVKDPAGLLGVHQIIIDAARLLNAARYDVFRDLVERHALRLVVRQLQQLLQMPRDRLSLAVRVSCEVDVLCSLGCAAQLGDDRGLAGQWLIVRFKIVLQIDAHLALGQVAQVAHAGLDAIIRAEIFSNGLCFRR